MVFNKCATESTWFKCVLNLPVRHDICYHYDICLSMSCSVVHVTIYHPNYKLGTLKIIIAHNRKLCVTLNLFSSVKKNNLEHLSCASHVMTLSGVSACYSNVTSRMNQTANDVFCFSAKLEKHFTMHSKCTSVLKWYFAIKSKFFTCLHLNNCEWVCTFTIISW